MGRALAGPEEGTGSLCWKQGPYVRDSPSDPADWPELSVPSPLGGLPVLSFLSERSLPNRTLRTASGWLAQPILSLRRARIRRGSPSYRRRSELSRLALPLLALFMCERRRCWLPVHVSGWENSLCVWSVLTPKKVDFYASSKLSVPLGPRALYCPVRSCPYLPSPAPPAVRWTVRTFKIGVYNIARGAGGARGAAEDGDGSGALTREETHSETVYYLLHSRARCRCRRSEREKARCRPATGGARRVDSE